METCLRRIALTTDVDTARQLGAARPAEMYVGVAAYQLLIEITTGLRSAVPGETNVFGQFRRAWESFRRDADTGAIGPMAQVVAQAVRDTRAIRHRHLQDIGGSSYGTLARRLLQPRDDERVLFVGAGELARSMLPFFRACELGVWNRRLPGPSFAAAARLFAPGEGARAAEWAHHVVLTTPADAENDERWARWLQPSLAQAILHLGHRRGSTFRGPVHAVSYDLDDLFDLRRSQDNIRSLQLERARLACREAASRAVSIGGPVIRRIAAG
jgi:hypothetical protein